MQVLVVRAREQADTTAERLARLGYAPLVAPILEIVATEQPPPEGPFDGLVVTSANALLGRVGRLKSDEAGRPPSPLWGGPSRAAGASRGGVRPEHGEPSPPPPTPGPSPRGGGEARDAEGARPDESLLGFPPALQRLLVFAVGRRTAEAAVAAGLGPVVSAESDGEALARLIAATLPPGAKLLHAAGRDRKPEPAASLVRAGFQVETWTAYEARAAPRLPGAIGTALRAGSVAAALHYSARSAGLLARLAVEAGLERALAELPHACLSDDVAAALASLTPGRIAVAARPDEASLLDALRRLAPPRPAGAGSRPPQSGC